MQFKLSSNVIKIEIFQVMSRKFQQKQLRNFEFEQNSSKTVPNSQDITHFTKITNPISFNPPP